MNIQLDFWYDSDQLKVFKSIYKSSDQKAVTQELTRLYLDFIRIQREKRNHAKPHSIKN